MASASPAESLRRTGFLWLVAATLGWGLNWPALKLLLRDWPPLFARGTAGLVGALLVAAYAAAIGERLAVPRGAWPRLAAASFTNVFAWMGLSTAALLWLGVAETALLVYTMPVWAMLLAWPIAGARPTARGVLALVVSLSGVALIMSGGGVALGAAKLPGIALGLSAAILFAIGTVGGRKPLPLPPFAATAWQVGLGCIPMILIGLALERDRIGPMSATGWTAWTYMAIIPMGLSYVGWFAAVRGLSPQTAATGSLLVPVIGVLAAAGLIGEPLGWREILAMALTLSGVALALRSRGG